MQFYRVYLTSPGIYLTSPGGAHIFEAHDGSDALERAAAVGLDTGNYSANLVATYFFDGWKEQPETTCGRRATIYYDDGRTVVLLHDHGAYV